MIQPGTMLGDRYEIIDLIGAGGMANVYKARCHKLNRYVAIKVLKAEYSSNKNFVSKFRVEAQSAAGLMHPNIVNVYDVGEEDGMYYFVMELVEGITLKNYIEKKIRIQVREAISIAIQVSSGIEAAHNNGIIHRDIKPQNIIISKDGKVKVADFGIARAASSDTITSHAMGSVHYTSPEQARGGYSDCKSDIYSIGITLFEMITGRVPFDGETTVAIAIKHIQEEMPSPRIYVPDVPVSVEQIIYKCTQKNPDRRYANVSELIADLKRSLISPDENFVVISQAASAEGTKAISDDDRHNMRQQMSVEQALTNNGYVQNPYANVPNPYGAQPNYQNQSQNQQPQQSQYASQNQYSESFADTEDLEQIDLFSPRSQRGQAIDSNKGNGDHAVRDFAKQPVNNQPKKNRIKNQPQPVKKGNKPEKAPKIKDKDYYDDFEDDEDVDPRMEKVMTVLLIVAAVVIAVVAIVVIGNVLGLFGKSSGKEDDTATEAESGMTAVPDLVGKSFDEASKLLTDANLVASAERSESAEYDKDYIISQDIEPGTMVEEGTSLKLVISSGKIQGLSVPDVVGKSEAEAKVILDNEGFTMAVEYVQSDSVQKGNVISQSPLGATIAPKGSAINVKISGDGSPVEGGSTEGNTGDGSQELFKSKVPDLVGKDETTAKSMLTTAGLNWGTITEEHNESVAAGLVLSQSVASETEVDRGTAVDIIISLGPSSYTCRAEVQAPADYFVTTEAVIIITDVTNAEVGRFTTNTFPYTVSQTGIPSSAGFITIQYQGVDEQWHTTSPVAVAFTQE